MNIFKKKEYSQKELNKIARRAIKYFPMYLGDEPIEVPIHSVGDIYQLFLEAGLSSEKAMEEAEKRVGYIGD